MNRPIFSFAKLMAAVALVVALVVGAEAQASDSFEAMLADLNAKKFSAKIDAIEAMAASGDERAVPTLKAMLEGKLFYRKEDGAIFIAEKKGSVFLLTSPLTMAASGEAKKNALGKIRVNNKIRGIISGSLDGLNLLSPDTDIRANAVAGVIEKPSAALLPTVKKALDREDDASLKEQLLLAKAAIELFAIKDEAVQKAALETMAENPTPAVGSLLAKFSNQAKGDLKKQADKALANVKSSLRTWEMVGDLYRGISLGSVLLLAAVGLAITFGVMGVINMAHGEMVMLGAYSTYVVQQAFHAFLPGALDYSLLVAIPVAFAVAGCVGIAIERGIIRFLYGRPLETLLATWGLSLILQQFVRSIFGPTNKEVIAPSWMSGSIDFSTGLSLTYNRLWIILFAFLVVGLIALILRRTAFGLHMRAVTQNRSMASSMGIKTGMVDSLTFGLGSGIAGIAGVALSQIDNVSPNLGQTYIIDSFMVVVFGGVGNLWGTVVGAMSLGVVNKFLEPISGAVLAKILVLIALILFIQKRPRGLFALKGRAVEA